MWKKRSNDSCTLRRFTIYFPQWIFYGLTKNVSIISMYRGKRNPTNKNAQIFMTWYHLRSFPRDQMSAEKREVCEPIKKRTEEREPSGEVESQELCLAWNEYINILSVARNQISVWFIELIYGFLLSLSLSLWHRLVKSRPDRETPVLPSAVPIPVPVPVPVPVPHYEHTKINKNICHKIWLGVERVRNGTRRIPTEAQHKQRVPKTNRMIFRLPAVLSVCESVCVSMHLRLFLLMSYLEANDDNATHIKLIVIVPAMPIDKCSREIARCAKTGRRGEYSN